MNENDTINNNVAGVPQPQLQPQPQPVAQTEQQPQMSSVMNVPQEQKKANSKILAIVVVTLIAIVAIVVAVILIMKNNNGISLDSVKNYCEKNAMEISEDTSSELEMNYITCQVKTAYDENEHHDIGITFGVLKKSFTEYEQFNEIRDVAKDSGLILESSDDYMKIYMPAGSNGVAYMIIDGNTYLQLAASDNDLAKATLIELGYPDRSWPTEQEMKNVSGLQMSQRDTQRRNDIARLDTSIVMYQTNNTGELPVGPSYWRGTAEISCEDGNVACKFVQNYLNNSTTNNDFVDPDGTPYSVYITENWATNSAITPIFGSNDSYLVETNNGYTIGGEAAFEQHVVYVVSGGRCDGNEVFNSEQKRHFAILYKMEDDTVYCLDDQ